MLFIAQLWKYNGGRLENKNGDWMYMRETWILPIEDKENEDFELRNFQGNSLNAYLDSRGN